MDEFYRSFTSINKLYFRMELRRIILLCLLPLSVLGQVNRSVRTGVTSLPLTRTYATFNPSSLATLRMSLSNGNLTATHTSGGDGSTLSTYAITGTTAIYIEFTAGSTTTITAIGIAKSGAETFDLPGRNSLEWSYRNDGQKMTDGTASAYGATWTSGDIISLLLDLSAGTLVYYVNGTTQGTAFSSLSGTFWIKFGSDDAGSSVITANFGASAFTYTVPGGYLSGLYIN